MKKTITVILASLCLTIGGWAHKSGGEEVKPVVLEQVAQSARQWTGIAVMPDGRIFVNFPRWSDDVPVSVGELRPDGSVRAFPNAEWNSGEAWTGGTLRLCAERRGRPRRVSLGAGQRQPQVCGSDPGRPETPQVRSAHWPIAGENPIRRSRTSSRTVT